MNLEEIIAALYELAPWKAEPVYSEEQSDRLIATAKALQKAETAVLAEALREFIVRTMWMDDSDQQWSKVFLLLRVMFDLPEAADSSEAAFFGGWMIPWRSREVSGQVDLGWPLRWRAGRPELVAGFSGYKGPAYRAEAEYLYYLDHYSLRGLD